MGKVYVFHNFKDEKTRAFFSGLFQASGTETSWGNCAEISSREEAAERAKKEIRESDSLFLALPPDLMEDFQARQWFYWASGYAQCRDIWVLQNYADIQRILAPLYGFKHHVVYLETPVWADYLATAIRDRRFLPAASPLVSGVKAEAAGTDWGAYFDPATERPLADCSASRPVRFYTSCRLYKTPYILHMPEDMKITRCLDCHRFYALQSTRQPSLLPAKA